ncbi:hypothetical protein FRB94_002080 [Tulasnella sp. JGI-2019a]|nr:hypothetical protein FRB93_012878 [Tulasnella sp. JGI-2019a]KAG9004763.1 hypothetical protein FRB94_002080 [Tulasnella sp. JGI-2019a]KAG9036789.1 hypothetical protein FRB95_007887 [Tulasnella sp. JGI-2019a]
MAYSLADLPSGLPVIDLDMFLKDPQSVEGSIECKKAANALVEYGALYVKDSRYSESDNDAFLDIMEDYFSQPAELLKKDERPEYGFQVGATPEGTEHPSCMSDDTCRSFVQDLDPEERPSDLGDHRNDHKSRFSYITGHRPPYETEFPFLDMPNVEPAGFNDWTATLKRLADSMKNAVESVGEMAALGLGLEQDIFTKATSYGPHWLAPTASDLARHGDNGTILSGVHRDIDFLTIHGRSRYPGLNIWARNCGKRIAVRLPPGPHLFVHAGKQLQVLSGGLIKADFHEVVVNDATLQAIETTRTNGVRPLIRVSSSFFWHLNHDFMLDPIPSLSQKAREMSAASSEWEGDTVAYVRMKVGTYIQKELNHVAISSFA